MPERLGKFKNLTEYLEPVSASDILKNRARLGYSCPREHYVKSIPLADLPEISLKWALPMQDLRRMCESDGWKVSRAEFHEKVRVMKEMVMAGDAADLESQGLIKNLEMWETLREAVMKSAEKGYSVEISPLGVKWNKPFTPKTFLDISRAASVIQKGIEDNIASITGDKKDEGNTGAIERIVYHVHGRKDGEKEIKESRIVDALPAPEQDDTNV